MASLGIYGLIIIINFMLNNYVLIFIIYWQLYSHNLALNPNFFSLIARTLNM